MTTIEVEAQIGMAERVFDRACDRVQELETALRSTESSLERSFVEFNRERIRTQIRLIETALVSARSALSDARTQLESMWALRNGSQQNGEGAASSVEGQRE
jgi:hypothetical protein